jgi:hypothetical protein
MIPGYKHRTPNRSNPRSRRNPDQIQSKRRLINSNETCNFPGTATRYFPILRYPSLASSDIKEIHRRNQCSATVSSQQHKSPKSMHSWRLETLLERSTLVTDHVRLQEISNITVRANHASSGIKTTSILPSSRTDGVRLILVPDGLREVCSHTGRGRC